MTPQRVAARRALGIATPASSCLVLALLAFPGVAAAHGPIAPAASSYFAKVLELPSGLKAKVVDGDLRMWMRVPASETLVVVDYREAPYLRFSRSGVEVNRNSSIRLADYDFDRNRKRRADARGGDHGGVSESLA